MENIKETNEALKEEVLEDDPELRDMFARAQAQEFEHTMFEIWEDQLQGMIKATEADMNLSVIDSILRAWPWLTYSDIPKYQKLRLQFLNEALDALREAFPKDREELFKENKDDWELHTDGYLEVLAKWSNLSNSWQQAWSLIPMTDKSKGLWHAVVVDMTGALVGPNGVVEGIQALRGFAMTDEIRERLAELISGEDDE